MLRLLKMLLLDIKSLSPSPGLSTHSLLTSLLPELVKASVPVAVVCVCYRPVSSPCPPQPLIARPDDQSTPAQRHSSSQCLMTKWTGRPTGLSTAQWATLPRLCSSSLYGPIRTSGVREREGYKLILSSVLLTFGCNWLVDINDY